MSQYSYVFKNKNRKYNNRLMSQYIYDPNEPADFLSGENIPKSDAYIGKSKQAMRREFHHLARRMKR